MNFNLIKVNFVKYTFDGADTDYHCTMFKLPDNWNEKRHLIRVLFLKLIKNYNLNYFFCLKYETLYSPGNEENLHHWVIHECNADYENVFLKNNSLPKPGQCFSASWLETYKQCGQISLVWAVGGDLVT